MLEIEYQEILNKIKDIIKKRLLDKYIKRLIQYEMIISSKPGGQYMQRRHTKVRAKFKTIELEKILANNFSIKLTTNQKLFLREKEKYLMAISEDSRSQSENKKIATERLLKKIYQLTNELFPSFRSQVMQEPFEAEEKRIKEKKNRSYLKQLRRKIKDITHLPEEQS